jgi:hypothetical protein
MCERRIARWREGELSEDQLERVMGIEPTARAWEARVLPLYDTRNGA